MEAALKVLRDRSAGTVEFRKAAKVVCEDLSRKALALVREEGADESRIVLVVILRAAIAFLAAAVDAFPNASVGVLGLKRDEHTLEPHWYYENLPELSQESAIILLDPMLATGGSAEAAVRRLKERGADPKKIYFIGVIAAPEGIMRLSKQIPKEHIRVAVVDEKLDDAGYIIPGLGDFGDRYFGYSGQSIIGSS